VQLNNDQFGELIQQYVEIVVDQMDRKTMEEWITDELIFQYGKLTNEELKERVDCYYEEGLFEELVNNVTTNTITNSHRWGFNQ
jgi:Leu/Phe-tRNA-protein transferase